MKTEPAEKRLIYLDHSATTPTHPDVFREMSPYFTEHFGNPSSLYSIAEESRDAVNNARKSVAAAIGAFEDEIFFTAGGTESDNWALKGIAYANRERGNHIITSVAEHHAIIHTCEFLEQQGFDITYLPVDKYGTVDIRALKDAITDSTILVSVMFANNEVGTIQPVREIGNICRERKIYFHTDAVQAVGNVQIDVSEMNIDLLSLSGHKFYGPKGIGALYVRRGVVIDNFIHGGGQERSLRAGTENLPGIVGLGRAIELATSNIEEHNETICAMRDKLCRGIIGNIPDTILNGHPKNRLAGNVNISFRGVDGEALLMMLNRKGICVSTGSACSAGSEGASHVLSAMGIAGVMARSSLRFSIGDLNSMNDIDYVLDVLPAIVKKLRALSPL